MWDIVRNKNDNKSTNNRDDENLIDAGKKSIQNHDKVLTNNKKTYEIWKIKIII